ncbi:MAG: hypothetical protein KBC32_09305 [Candidatus Didemnitutus sp.]|nr:hypothetical protein [Candidatus Didemnitutus sp.]
MSSQGLADPVQAIPAESFVSSTGVATHWRKEINVYAYFGELSDKLIDSSLAMCRASGASPAFVAKLQQLSLSGTQTILLINPIVGTKPSADFWAAAPNYAINDFIRMVGPGAIRYVEMNNELDSPTQYGGTYWRNLSEPLSADANSPFFYASYLRAATPAAQAALKGDFDEAINRIPLIGPSLGEDTAYAEVGDLTPSIDHSNVHHYLFGSHPEATNIRSIDHAIANRTSIQSPTKSYAVTEGGGGTAASLSATWPIVTHGRYIPRFYFAHFLKGSAATCSYELVDEGLDPANQQHNFGLLYNDLTPKPAYTAIQNLLSLLKDPGPDFIPSSLDYSLSGSTSDVWSVLFQKRNGDFFLCLWLGLSSYDRNAGQHIVVPAQRVNVSLPASIASAIAYTLDDSGRMTATSAAISNREIALNVTDRVTTLRLSPSTNGGAASRPTGLRASASANQIVLKWAPTVEATSFTLKRGTSPTSLIPLATGLTANNYTDTSVSGSTTYYYSVCAVHVGGISSDSALASARTQDPVIIDNTDATLTGTWTSSTANEGYYGADYLIDDNTGTTGGKSARFTPNLPIAGRYLIYLRWTAGANRASNVPVDINHAFGTITTSINQKANNGTWLLIGAAHFNAGQAGNILLRNDGANFHVIADAAQFVLAPPLAPTGLTFSSGDTDLSLTWTAAEGANSYLIKRATSPSGPYHTIASGITSNVFTDTGLTQGTRYYYTVASLNDGGISSDSPPVYAATNDPADDRVPTLTINQSNGGDGFALSFQWPPSSTASLWRLQSTEELTGTWIDVAESINGNAWRSLDAQIEITHEPASETLSIFDRRSLNNSRQRFWRLMRVR